MLFSLLPLSDVDCLPICDVSCVPLVLGVLLGGVLGCCPIWSCVLDVPPLLGLLEGVVCARANPAHSSRNVVVKKRFFIIQILQVLTCKVLLSFDSHPVREVALVPRLSKPYPALTYSRQNCSTARTAIFPRNSQVCVCHWPDLPC